MVKKQKYSLYEFISLVKIADELYEYEGKRWKAFRTLKNALKNYDGDIPAYYYMKYYFLWKAFEEDYEVDYAIEKMTEDELSARISDAIRMNRSYQRKDKVYQKNAKKIFGEYLQGTVTVEILKNRLYVLEKQFLSTATHSIVYEDEINTIFQAYFYERETISRDIVNLYSHYFKQFRVQEYQEAWRKRAQQMALKDEKWPKPLKCAIPASKEYRIWNYCSLDPTIHRNRQAKKGSSQQEEDRLAIFQSLIEFERDDKGKKLLHEGCPVITNWMELSGQYPELAEKLVERGSQYCQKREEHQKMQEAKKEQELLAIPVREREKIVRIYDPWDDRWLSVIE